MIISLSGTAGSGKSTVASLVARQLNLKHYSQGSLMRELAREKGLSLEELGKLAEKDPTIDKNLDEKQIKLGQTEDNFIIEGRLSFYFIPHSIKIFLDASLKKRALRIWKDISLRKIRVEEKAKTLQEVIEKIRKREISERKRYLQYYNINPYDKKHYDLVIDTSYLSPEEVTKKIVHFIENKENKKSYV